MYIKDAVNAYLTLAANISKPGVRGNAFNFGTNTPISVVELFTKIAKLCGSNAEPVILNEAKNEIQDQFLSAEKACKMLGWTPKYSLDDGLKETIVWYREYMIKKGMITGN
jgi:CDP-glucose 4,6-dehydratase